MQNLYKKQGFGDAFFKASIKSDQATIEAA
jgi:hypothetical protein